ncbi:Histidine protein methyltransferase 1 [Mactra antiquata]
MFTFNFPDPSSAENGAKADDKQEQCTLVDDISHLEPFNEILESAYFPSKEIPVVSFKVTDDLSIKCLDSHEVEKCLINKQKEDSCITEAVKQHSDLIPNVYEGGMKVWECAIDLTDYLHKIHLQFNGKNVLEVGCGAGIPGIMSMLKGADNVHLQDYNKEVIEAYTIPNVILNKTDQCKCTCRYFSGDWNYFREQMIQEQVRYDIILTAETIYKTENYKKLTQIFHSFLTDEGVIFVAAKSHYYGVGGGVCDFECFVKKEGIFHIETCCTIDAGVPRQILKLTRKSSG